MRNLDGKSLDGEIVEGLSFHQDKGEAMPTVPFAPAGIDHVVLRVADLPRSLAFYEKVLGCKTERNQEDIGLWQLRAGAALIDLVPVDGVVGRRGGPAPGSNGHNMDHLALAIRPFDRAALQAHLARHGVAVEGGSDGNYGAEGESPALIIRDPDGNMIELMGPGRGPKSSASPLEGEAVSGRASVR
jgi:catechol 2,3-dioxygenase-like lactoylglutathione lyase family enzyme